jgi:integrase/recombinase XerD
MTKKNNIDTSLPAIIKPDPSHDLVIVVDRLKNLSPETKNTYKFAMKSYENYCQNKGLKPDLDSLLQWLESVDASTTQATYIAAVKRIFSEIYKDDPRLPEFKESLEEIRPVKRDMSITESGYLTEKEIKELIKVAPENIGLMIEVLYQTGLRITELLSIKLEDCQLIERKGKKPYREVKVKQKRNKTGTVFINDNLYKKVYKFFKSKKFLFEHDGKPYTRQFVSMEIKRIGAQIGRPEIHAHTIRHSFATHLVKDRKLSIDQVQRAMNHSSAQTTIQFYIHNKPTPEDLGVI